MADVEKELKKVRDEAAQRRVELSPYKKAFENFDEEARDWLLETVELINSDPFEAGARFATLAYGNMGEDGFRQWAQEVAFDGDLSSVENKPKIGENSKMSDDVDAKIASLEEKLLGAINQNNNATKEMMEEQQRREQFREITQIINDLGYDPDSWQGKMLVQVATSEIDKSLDIAQRLSKADDVVRERLGGKITDNAATEEAPKNIQIGNAEVQSEPLNVPPTGGQVGGGGIANIAENQPATFGDADDALMTLLKSEVG